MQVTIHAAKTSLSKLIEAASKGEEVIIAKGRGTVVMRHGLVLVSADTAFDGLAAVPSWRGRVR